MSENRMNDAKRTPYKIEFEHEDFGEDYKGKYMSSITFCKKFSDIMRETFANYAGCEMEPVKTPMGEIPMISAYFTHMDKIPEGNNGDALHLATSRDSANKVGSTIIDNMRARDNVRNNGDAFVITDDGKDILLPLLMYKYYNGGKPNWKQITVEVTMPDKWNRPAQYTKVFGLDPDRVASFIWGNKNKNGEFIDYGVAIVKDLSVMMGMPNMNGGRNFALKVDVACKSQLERTYAELGLGMVGSRMV
jgi:hypothetical protein